MPAARIAKPANQSLEVLRLPSPEKGQMAKEIRRAGGTVPANMLPTRLGAFKLGTVAGDAAARKLATTKAAEVAKQHSCQVRSLNRTPRAWIAHIVPEVK